MIDWPALEAANAPLNAFVDWDKLASGGMTVGVKANIAVKGLPWTAGMALYRDRIADRDAAVVAALRASGAAIIGSLNLEEAALGAKTDNPWFGATQNPHRLGYTPGGSSGGSGAAVAAGLCDVALGSDTMGSVRIPAAYCGVYGFKPAHTAISQDGLELAEPSFDTIGVLARHLGALEQVSRLISVFCGESDTLAEGVTLSDLGGVDCAAAVLAAFSQAKAAIGRVQSARLSAPLARIRFAGFIKTSRTMAAHFAASDPALLSPALLSPALRKLLTYGPRRSDADWQEDQRILAQASDEVRALVAANGFIILPTTPQSAFPHSETAPANQADFTCLANIAGLPAISLPTGWTDVGLPIGVQLIGQAGQEAELFALATRLDTALAAYRPPANFIGSRG